MAVEFRPAAGQGIVVRVRNTSPDRTLGGVWIGVTAAGGATTGQVTRMLPTPLAPGQEVELGRADLSGWELRPGETVRVWRFDPYEWVMVQVPAPARGR